MTRTQWLAEIIAKVDGKAIGRSQAKHQKMASTPFVFYRGSAQLFYADLSTGLLSLPEKLMTIPLTTIMGDCHSSNFGFLTEEGSHGDKVIFTANDFDDACIGHASWDLLRFATSISLCVDHCHGIATGDYIIEDEELASKIMRKPLVTIEEIVPAITAFLDSYVDTCKQGIKNEKHFADAIESFDEQHILYKHWQKAVKRAANGQDFYFKSALAKAVNITPEGPMFISNSTKFTAPSAPEYAQLLTAFAPYADDQVLDIVKRLDAGTGSVNMSRYYLLIGPKAFNNLKDFALCHIIEVKQQRPAAPLFYFDNISVRNKLNPAHLTAHCQRRMQRSPDLVLDEVEWQQAHWLIRSRHHAKVGIDPHHIASGEKCVTMQGLSQYTKICGKALALAHCRGDRRSTRFEQAVCQLLPKYQREFITAALKYAEQVKTDHLLFQKIISRQ